MYQCRVKLQRPIAHSRANPVEQNYRNNIYRYCDVTANWFVKFSMCNTKLHDLGGCRCKKKKIIYSHVVWCMLGRLLYNFTDDWYSNVHNMCTVSFDREELAPFKCDYIFIKCLITLHTGIICKRVHYTHECLLVANKLFTLLLIGFFY